MCHKQCELWWCYDLDLQLFQILRYCWIFLFPWLSCLVSNLIPLNGLYEGALDFTLLFGC